MQLLKYLTNFILWLSLSLLGLAVFRHRKRIVVLAPINSAFADNVKYAYLWLSEEKDLCVRFITYDKLIRDELLEKGIKVLYYPSIRAVLALLRASVVIGSATVPFHRIRGHLTAGAKLVQLWHGAGIKKVLLGTEKYEKKNWTLKNRFDWFITRKIPEFDLIYFPSEKLKEIRKDWFKYKEAKINGFVRNDVFIGKSFGVKQDICTDAEIINLMKAYKDKGSKLVLYAPTFRERRKPVFEDRVFFDFHSVDQMMIANEGLLIIKQHPWVIEQLNLSNFSRIFEYAKEKDIYPCLAFFDILITDYSSVFSDYALLKRPVIHYIPDYKRVLDEQGISEDIAAMLPGPVFENFHAFSEYLELLLKGLIKIKLPDENIFHDHGRQLSGPQLIKDVRRLAKI
jgi:CDP-glycerol glycerophosphotransferase (TagB/SpsB family)